LKLLQGDSDQLPVRRGTGGLALGDGGRHRAPHRLRQGDRAGQAGSPPFLEASVADIEFSEGRFPHRRTDRSIGVMEVAERTRTAKLPADLPQKLDRPPW